jgi:hypothetical protein
MVMDIFDFTSWSGGQYLAVCEGYFTIRAIGSHNTWVAHYDLEACQYEIIYFYQFSGVLVSLDWSSPLKVNSREQSYIYPASHFILRGQNYDDVMLYPIKS